MTKIKVKQLIFDKWNVIHIKKHDVKPEEIIEAGVNLIYHRKTYKGRYLAVGRSGNRLISFVINREGSSIYYLVTARDAEKKERRRVYEKEKHKQKK
ncbi:MAG: hypothetical protein A2W07_06350 [candidate division Zixibacteria bacterium RBG_16_43_9]|nr:MAG: hypothetical protein A2W07_06350 [candidate division Zixibacteria bacterium RBG_16_43_9]